LRRRRDADGVSPRAKQNKGALSEILDDRLASRNRVLLRLAGLVHDLGHSFLSHSSERIFGLIPPFPDLIGEVLRQHDKKPGAAEVVVYLLVTSSEWRDVVGRIWERCSGPGTPPTEDEWARIGRWVMGIEPEGPKKFLCDIVSGPVDADKLDYVARDAYFAGIPIAQDVDRFLSTVCIDRQTNPETTKEWWRLTLPLQKGINALEQLVMSKLVLYSYLYHHQKVRAAELTFERNLAREYLTQGRILGIEGVWDLFHVQDAHLYAVTGGRPGHNRAADVAYRVLPRRVVEFREQDVTLEEPDRARSIQEYRRLSSLSRPKSWDQYHQLLTYEDSLARQANLPDSSVIVDFPADPDYGDLESLVLPGRSPHEQATAKEHLSYGDWIQAYNKHRVYNRVFYFGDEKSLERLWTVLAEDFGARKLRLPERLQMWR